MKRVAGQKDEVFVKFEDVLRDIAGLRGIKIHSVKAGAEIVVEEVTDERVKVRTVNGTIKSRPTAELRQVWDALLRQPAVHVDSVLGGSGSSRNQPETIFANLPYIEVIYLQKKKHLTLGPVSHEPGTILEASLDRRLEVERKLKASEERAAISAVVLTSEMLNAAKALEGFTGIAPSAAGGGEYVARIGENVILLKMIANGPGSPKAGTYVILKGASAAHQGIPVDVLGRPYLAACMNGLNILLPKD